MLLQRSMTTCSGMFRRCSRVTGMVKQCGTPLRVDSFAQTRLMSSVQQHFDEAKERLNTLSEKPGNDVQLKIYALFKQATSGKVSTKRPGMTDFVGRAKWDAWSSLGDLSQDEAKQAYANLVNELVAEESPSDAAPASEYEFLTVTKNDGLAVITLNRPKKYNALTPKMYREWEAALQEAGNDPKTRIAAITGAGPFFCAGNDLNNFANVEDPPSFAKECGQMLYEFVDAFIQFPKPLVGVINGPALGVSVTTMALYDAVYASEKATFHTPFTSLGQSAEGCSSFTFPRLMGTGTAAEMLLFNKKMTAGEAKEAGLVTEVYHDETFQKEIWPKLQALAKLPQQSLIYGKELYREPLKQTLMEVNRRECTRLEERWLSDECREAVFAFLTRKK